jgi:CRP/FNR family transcriptional regulator, cyclic AMP receptor protein
VSPPGRPKAIRDLLAAHPFFADLPGPDLDLVAGCGQNVHFDAGQALFTEGGPADTFFVIRRGRVALSVHAPERQELVVGTAGDGDVLDWSWLFPPHRWTTDARAVDGTSAVVLDGACLRDKCDADSALGYRLMLRFAQLAQERLQQMRLQLLDLYGASVDEQLADR